MPTNCGIYQIVHKATGQRYIGSSTNLATRKRYQYCAETHTWAMGGFYNAKYTSLNADHFHYGIIEYFPTDISVPELRYREHCWIRLLPPELVLNINRKYDPIQYICDRCGHTINPRTFKRLSQQNQNPHGHQGQTI